MWLDSRSDNYPDPHADGRFNPSADRYAHADTITHSRTASAAGGDCNGDRERCAAHPGR